MSSDLTLRISVATLDRVVFRSPRDGALMLALERKATRIGDPRTSGIRIRAQPFGGAVRLRDPEALHDLIGGFAFDSARSRAEDDFRILIRPAAWESVKRLCIQHLQDPADPLLEPGPFREMAEEFAECLGVALRPDQLDIRPLGFVAENAPSPTDNPRSRGFPTVRLYHVFEVTVVDGALCQALLDASEHRPDSDLRVLALKDARANAALALPLQQVKDLYLGLPAEKRRAPWAVKGHQLATSVLAILKEVAVPQLQWL